MGYIFDGFISEEIMKAILGLADCVKHAFSQVHEVDFGENHKKLLWAWRSSYEDCFGARHTPKWLQCRA